MDGRSISRIEDSFEPLSSKKASSSRLGMVSSAFPDATRAGVRMLKKGGNAVDAACAAALALGVCEPQASGLGGQTISLVHIDGRTVSIDGSSRAPSLARASEFAKASARLEGHKAATIPSTVAAIGYMSERYGRLDWPDIAGPALRIARRGYRITKLQHALQKANLDALLRTRSGARYFLKDGCVPYEPGDLFVQEDLAETLSRISRFGYGSFYRGRIAREIDRDMRRNRGYIRRDDLAMIPVPVERRPIGRKYRGVMVRTVPPPGAGDTLLLILMMLRCVPKRRLASKGHEEYRYMSETFRKALLHRARRPLDPRTYCQARSQTHLSPGFARHLARSIKAHANSAPPVKNPAPDLEDTTHLCAMDSEGNAVSLTQSIELVYGSKAAADGLGFLYNNYMSAFEFGDAGHPFFLRPNAVPRSSACPTIVFRCGRPWIAAGSPGSSRIFSAVSLFLSRVLDEEASIRTALELPRIHCSMGGTVSMERSGAAARLGPYLEQKGYRIRMLERHSFYLGAVHATLCCQSREGFQGAAEAGRDGIAQGPS